MNLLHLFILAKINYYLLAKRMVWWGKKYFIIFDLERQNLLPTYPWGIKTS